MYGTSPARPLHSLHSLHSPCTTARKTAPPPPPARRLGPQIRKHMAGCGAGAAAAREPPLGWKTRIDDSDRRLGWMAWMVGRRAHKRACASSHTAMTRMDNPTTRMDDPATRMDDSDGRSSDSDGRPGWTTRMDDSDGRLGWTARAHDPGARRSVRMEDSNGRLGWATSMDDSDGRLVRTVADGGEGGHDEVDGVEVGRQHRPRQVPLPAASAASGTERAGKGPLRFRRVRHRAGRRRPAPLPPNCVRCWVGRQHRPRQAPLPASSTSAELDAGRRSLFGYFSVAV